MTLSAGRNLARTPNASRPDGASDAARVRLTAARRRDHDRTVELARTALGQITALQLPADPPSFELWYAYATGHHQALNRTINDLLQRNGEVRVEDLDQIRLQFLPPFGAAERVESVGTRIGDQVERVLAMIDTAIGSTASYRENLAGASRELDGAGGREPLRAIVESLVIATREMEQQNRLLQVSMRASQQELGELQGKLDQIRTESLTDGLTALPNRKHFDQALDHAILQGERDATPLSLLLCDVDHFKTFNDTYGHLTGDHVLRLIASALKQSVRGQDVAARYGGEEFAVILPDTTLSQAGIVAEHLRKAIAQREVVKRSTGEFLGRVTVSIGAAQYRPGDNALSLIERADRCLYGAKNEGRNRVVTQPAPCPGDWSVGLSDAS